MHAIPAHALVLLPKQQEGFIPSLASLKIGLYISADRIFIAKASSSVLFQLLKKVLIVDKD